MTREQELAFAILCSQNGWHKARIHDARIEIRNLIEQQEKEIEALKTLLSDIKLFEVDSGVERIKKGEPAFTLPLALRKRMQEVLR